MLNFEIQTMKDLFGKAILDYQTNNSPEDLITETSISEADEMSVAYLFRDFKEISYLLGGGAEVILHHQRGGFLQG